MLAEHTLTENAAVADKLAEKVSVTRQTIVAIEKGKYAPSLDLAFRLARAFDVPLEEVFFLEETTS